MNINPWVYLFETWYVERDLINRFRFMLSIVTKQHHAEIREFFKPLL